MHIHIYINNALIHAPTFRTEAKLATYLIISAFIENQGSNGVYATVARLKTNVFFNCK